DQRVHLYNYFFFQAEDGIRDRNVTGVQTCALPISLGQAGDGLADHRLVDAGGDVLGPGALVDEGLHVALGEHAAAGGDGVGALRSEERRVGKEWRARGVRKCERERERATTKNTRTE